jgi:hypothetical protein
MAVKWYSSGNFFSQESCRKSGNEGPLLDKALEQSFPPKDNVLPGTFVEIESIELDEIWYNNWRWGFKFKNGIASDFDSDYRLKVFKLPFAQIRRVEIYHDSWDVWGGNDNYLCGLKFFGEGAVILEIGDVQKKFNSVELAENERIIGI